MFEFFGRTPTLFQKKITIYVNKDTKNPTVTPSQIITPAEAYIIFDVKTKIGY